MKKKKKQKKYTSSVPFGLLPTWAKERILSEKEKDTFKNDTVYSLFWCNNCLVETSIDLARPKNERTKNVYIKTIKNKNGKVSNVYKHKTVCLCEKKADIFVKFKVCSNCGFISVNFKILHNKICHKCTQGKLKKRKHVNGYYLQMGKEIDKPEELIINQPMCVHRNDCLSFFFKRKYAENSFLCCNECPNFKRMGV